MKRKTIRLIFPEWQGGINPYYAMGAEVLSFILPRNNKHEILTVPVSKDYDKELEFLDGFFGKKEIITQQKAAYKLLEDTHPDRIITLGGDCSVSQAPFDYLHGKYGDNLGVLWLDAHPDISRPEDGANEHAMVLGNLIGDGAAPMAKLVEHPFVPEQFMYVGLVASGLMAYEVDRLNNWQIPYVTPKDLTDGNGVIRQWLRKKQFKHLLIHFDLDVLSPNDFYSLLCNEPHTPPVSYAVGQLRLKEAIQIILDAMKEASLVGLTIAEYMPWDMISLRKEFSKLDIFND